MWFKNLLIYRFTKPFELTAEQVEEKLQEFAFKPCASQDMTTLGWVKPLGQQGSELVHTNNGCIMVCSQRQDKVLPAAVVKDALEEKVLSIREDEDRVPSRKERADIKEQLIFEMLPRAFVKSRRQYAYIDPANGWLVVDSGSHARAEELIVLLRDSLGSMPVIPLAPKNTTYHTMTHWLQNAAPQGFELGGECELIDSADESAAIRCKNQNLASKEILNHIDSGMLVKKLTLSWSGGIEFLVDEKLAVKRLRFSDLIMERADEVHTDSAAEQFDVNFSIMNAELANFIPALIEAFGGEDTAALEAA